jgi:SAM-dependent methyltransferase
MADIAPLLRPGLRVLEVGCAEGSLGAAIKHSTALHYTGIELSGDADTAAQVLDRVVRAPTAAIVNEKFDLLLSFHVLEHVADITTELRHWRSLLADDGRLIVEVPNKAGHHLLDRDPNPEHLHQFTAASVAALLIHANFDTDRIESGHWESSVYSDSLRVVARPALTANQREALLLQRFRTHLPETFAAWGIGGDFRAYVEPLLDSLPVAALIDGAEQRQGERYGPLTVMTYDEQRHGNLPILVCSVRYREDILRDLAMLGVSPSRIVCLDDIFGTAEP